MKRISTTGKLPGLALIIILLVGFLLRFSYIHTPGHHTDMRHFVRWARLVARDGLGAVYEQTPSAYPPLGIAMLLPVGMMCPRCAVDAAPTTRELFVLRFISTGFDVLIAAFLFRLGKEARHVWGGLSAAALYSLVPTMIWISGWWGQNDAAFLFVLLIAGFLLARERAIPAWIFLALSILVKLQAIILLPVFVAGTWRWFGWRQVVLGAAAFVLTLALICAPIVLGRQLGNLFSGIMTPISQWTIMRSRITLGGHNLWAGFALSRHIDIWDSYQQPALIVFSGLTAYAAGTSLFLFSIALIAGQVVISSHPRFAFAAMSLTWIAFFQFEMGVGARYLLPSAILLLAMALESPIWWVPCIGWHVVTFFNVLDTLQSTRPYSWGFHDAFWDFYLPGGIATNIGLTITLSLVVAGMFFTLAGHQAFGGKRFRTNRLERCLLECGYAVLAIALTLWLRQNVLNQHFLEQVRMTLVNSMHEELEDSRNALVINWPAQIWRAPPHTGLLLPPAYTRLPAPEELGIDHDAAVIYLPWAEIADELYGWHTNYSGRHVTAEQLSEQILTAQRIMALSMLTEAPRVWRLAEVSDLAAGTTPVARFGSHAQLINARLEYHDRTMLVYLDWNVAQPLSDTITVFVHFLGPDRQLVAQADGDTVNNLVPLGHWHRHANQVVQEMRMAILPENAPRGAYTAAVGLYDRVTLERMPVACVRQRCENQAYVSEPVYVDE